MWGKDLEYRHSRVIQVIHFSSEVNLWVAPLLPTIAMHVPNYLEAHKKNVGKMRVVPLPVTMGDYYERTSPTRTTDPPVILILFKHRFFIASDDVIGR